MGISSQTVKGGALHQSTAWQSEEMALAVLGSRIAAHKGPRASWTVPSGAPRGARNECPFPPASPVLFKDLLIVNALTEGGTVAALNKATGKEGWKAGEWESRWRTAIH